MRGAWWGRCRRKRMESGWRSRGGGVKREGTPPAAATEPGQKSAVENGEAQRVPFRGARRTIAEHLRYSVMHAVHFTVMDEADVSELENIRRAMIARVNEKVSLLPFVAAAV